jgi:hypothetical protein
MAVNHGQKDEAKKCPQQQPSAETATETIEQAGWRQLSRNTSLSQINTPIVSFQFVCFQHLPLLDREPRLPYTAKR